MKLLKLSLVAAMAAGALATTASAVSLEEAIKDVDVSGMARMRYTHVKEKEGRVSDTESKWNFKSLLNFKTKIDDNFFGVIGVRYTKTDSAQTASSITTNDKSDNFGLYQGFLGYTVGNTTFQVGRQTVGAFFTDDMYGDGIKVLNSDIQGLTLAALWMDSLENDGDILSLGELDYNDKTIKDLIGKATTEHNLYGVAALGSYDPVSFQLWYASLEDVADLFAVELAANVAVNDGFDLGLKGQYAFADLDGKFKKALDAVPDYKEVSDSSFYGVEASANVFGADLSAGYVNFSTNKQAVSFSSFEDDGSFIVAGEELIDYALYSGKNRYMFLTAGYTIADTGVRVGADYLNGKHKSDSVLFDGGNYDMQEIVARVDYAYNKKLKFKSWYSFVEKDYKDSADLQQNTIRFEAKYSF